jgi:hypothetical protein
MARWQDGARKVALKAEVKQILEEDRDLLKSMVNETLQQALEAEMDEAVGAEKSQRGPNRIGYRSSYYGRNLLTRWEDRVAGFRGPAGPLPDRGVRAVISEAKTHSLRP